MGIEKRGLIFPRSSVTNREYGTRLDVPDSKFANPLRRPFSIEFRIGSGARMIRPSRPSGLSRGWERGGIKIMRCFNRLERDLGPSEGVGPANPDSTFADRALKPMIPAWFWFKLPSTDQQAKMKRTARPPSSLQSRPAGTILPPALPQPFAISSRFSANVHHDRRR